MTSFTEMMTTMTGTSDEKEHKGHKWYNPFKVTPWLDARGARPFILYPEWKRLKTERESIWRKLGLMDRVEDEDYRSGKWCAGFGFLCMSVCAYALYETFIAFNVFVPDMKRFLVMVGVLYGCGIFMLVYALLYILGVFHWRDSDWWRLRYHGSMFRDDEAACREWYDENVLKKAD